MSAGRRRARRPGSFLDSPHFAEVAPYIDVEIYGRDGSPPDHRARLEVRPPDEATAIRWLAITSPCVVCGALMCPIRERDKKTGGRRAWRHLYFAATCSWKETDGPGAGPGRLACSRSRASSAEVELIRRVIRTARALELRPARAPQPMPLFDLYPTRDPV